MTVEWDGSLSVGIETIDEDHKKLIEIINSVGGDDVKTRGQLADIINELLDYTRYHFNREEEMMAAKGYTNLSQHKGEHGTFIGKLLELAIMVETEDLKKTREEASTFLLTWLTAHIRKSDFDYIPTLKS